MIRLLFTDVWFVVSMACLLTGVVGAVWCLAASRPPQSSRGAGCHPRRTDSSRPRGFDETCRDINRPPALPPLCHRRRVA
jgi:hypothetical protein